jgi:hydrogenase nickel incorporation protein HypA/HybF
MHELSIAQNILEIVEENANLNKNAKVVLVEIEIGEMSGVISEALKLALEIIVKGTIIENAEIKIFEISGEAICNKCSKVFISHDLYSSCPNCSSYENIITRGKEMKIKSITFESEN